MLSKAYTHSVSLDFGGLQVASEDSLPGWTALLSQLDGRISLPGKLTK